MCLLSGPVGVGKTSLAHAVFLDSNRIVVDVRAKPDDFMALMDDLVCTPPLRSVGVVVDEVENMPAPERTFLIKLLTKRTPQAHILLVCTDPNERALKSVVKLCDTHVRMFTPREGDVRGLLTKLCSQTGIELPLERAAELVRCVNGDMRQLVTTLWEIKQRNNTHINGTDVRFHNPFDASNTVLRACNIEEGVTAAQTDRMMVRLMTVKHLPHCVENDIDSLCARMELVSCADMLEAHPSYTTLEHALWVHVAATSGTIPSDTPRLHFPAAELGIRVKRKSNYEAMTRVVNAFRGVYATHNLGYDFREIVQAQMSSDAALQKRISVQTSKQDVKRVQDIVFK